MKLLLLPLPVLFLVTCGYAQDGAAARRRQLAQEFHRRAQERTGVLVPMYIYPENPDKNPAYNQLMALRRRYETVPMWVIVNPASGPGKQVDANYGRVVTRLRGAGCVVLGYVSTSHGKRPAGDVRKEIDRWLTLYPDIHGIFFDEMINDNTEAAARYQASLSQYAHDTGCWPSVANPGTDTPSRYFAAAAADVIIVHEDGTWPKEERLRGDKPGGYADYPPFTRGVLVHSQPTLDRAALRMVRKYARWIYVTEGLYRPGDAKAANPWDRLSRHLEDICGQLCEK
jgi:hypothetical protein